MINPGSRPVEPATEQNLGAFIEEATERGLRLAGEPERHPEADVGGRYAWVLPLEDGGRVEVLMPGADIAQVRDDPTAQAFTIRVNGHNWWWRQAAGMAVPISR